MTTQCVVRAAERPSAAARELAPAVRYRKFEKTLRLLSNLWSARVVVDTDPYTDTEIIQGRGVAQGQNCVLQGCFAQDKSNAFGVSSATREQ